MTSFALGHEGSDGVGRTHVGDERHSSVSRALPLRLHSHRDPGGAGGSPSPSRDLNHLPAVSQPCQSRAQQSRRVLDAPPRMGPALRASSCASSGAPSGAPSFPPAAAGALQGAAAQRWPHAPSQPRPPESQLGRHIWPGAPL